MNILMCDTQYTFFLYYLLMPFHKFKDTFFIFDVCFNPSVVHALKSAGMACHQKTFYDLPLNKRPMARVQNREYLANLIKEIADYCNGDVCIYGQDHIGIAQTAWDDRIKHIPFILLEDGVGNYCKKERYMKDRPDFLQSNETLIGHNSRVQDIYLTGIWRIPNDLKKKVKIMDISSLWKEKSPEEKLLFLSFYHLERDILDVISKKTSCFLDSALSVFGFIPVEQEFRICKKVLSQFNVSDVYIKTHPTGSTINFQQEFPGITVFTNPLPFEVLYFLTGDRLKSVASICSTASMVVNEDVEQQFYDREGNRIEIRYPYDELV